MSPDEFEQYYEHKLERLEEMGGMCKAPDCAKAVVFPRNYCSTVCMNVGLRVAARKVDSGVKELPENEIQEIRENTQEGFDRMQKKIDDHE